MYGIADDIDALLGKKDFWYWVIGINLSSLLCMAQPIVLGITLGVLIILLTVKGVLRSFQRGYVWTLCKFLVKAFGVLLLFSLTTSAIRLCLELLPGMRDPAMVYMTAFVLNGVLWAVVIVTWMLRRHRRQQTEQESSRRQSEEYSRSQTASRRLAGADQRRRENARSACELLYALHAAEIGKRYPRSEFDAFATKYLSDSHEPGYVEEKAEQLKAIIEQQRQKIDGPAKKMSLPDLARWYEATRLEIDGSPLPSRQKNVQLAQLSNRYQELVQEVLQEMTP